MNKLSTTRALTYATGFVVGVSGILSVLGLADFDPKTGMVDLHPISVYAIAGMIVPVFSTGLALIAVLKGWSTRK